MNARPRLLVALAALSLVAVGCGPSMDHGSMGHGAPAGPAGGSAPSRTIDVAMADVRFDPAAISVKAGETVRFVFHNTGTLAHEAVIGDDAAQAHHEQQMAGQAMEHGAGAVTVPPGATGELTHTFATAGQTLIGCHEPGHYGAGMKLAITVT
jgi:uncharacterized cupredoxin-like copper-binding protein